MTYVQIVPPYDPNEPGSVLGAIECFVIGGFVGFALWKVHPVFGIVGGIGAAVVYYWILRALRTNRSSGFAKVLIFLFALASAGLYGFVGYRIALFFAPRDNIWQVFGLCLGAGLAFLDRWQLARRF